MEQRPKGGHKTTDLLKFSHSQICRDLYNQPIFLSQMNKREAFCHLQNESRGGSVWSRSREGMSVADPGLNVDYGTSFLTQGLSAPSSSSRPNCSTLSHSPYAYCPSLQLGHYIPAFHRNISSPLNMVGRTQFWGCALDTKIPRSVSPGLRGGQLSLETKESHLWKPSFKRYTFPDMCYLLDLSCTVWCGCLFCFVVFFMGSFSAFKKKIQALWTGLGCEYMFAYSPPDIF